LIIENNLCCVCVCRYRPNWAARSCNVAVCNALAGSRRYRRFATRRWNQRKV